MSFKRVTAENMTARLSDDSFFNFQDCCFRENLRFQYPADSKKGTLVNAENVTAKNILVEPTSSDSKTVEESGPTSNHLDERSSSEESGSSDSKTVEEFGPNSSDHDEKSSSDPHSEAHYIWDVVVFCLYLVSSVLNHYISVVNWSYFLFDTLIFYIFSLKCSFVIYIVEKVNSFVAHRLAKFLSETTQCVWVWPADSVTRVAKTLKTSVKAFCKVRRTFSSVWLVAPVILVSLGNWYMRANSWLLKFFENLLLILTSPAVREWLGRDSFMVACFHLLLLYFGHRTVTLIFSEIVSYVCKGVDYMFLYNSYATLL